MTWVEPQVTIPNAEIGGETVDGTFVFPEGVSIEYEVRTDEFFQSEGTTATVVSSLLEYAGLSDAGNIRQELSWDLGGGIHAITIDFRGFEGSPHQWGDTGNPETSTPTDATGEDVHAQMAVFDKYLNSATIDSTNPALLSVGEYSDAGRYAPLEVVPENPNAVFDAGEQSSVWDGSATWVETISLEQAIDATGMEAFG